MDSNSIANHKEHNNSVSHLCDCLGGCKHAIVLGVDANVNLPWIDSNGEVRDGTMNLLSEKAWSELLDNLHVTMLNGPERLRARPRDHWSKNKEGLHSH